MSKIYRALALFSGGLDSLLAVKWMQLKGVEVIPIFFKTPFFTEERALHTAQANGLTLEIIDIFDQHLQMLQNPRYGFGKNFNPCIDCHGLMFQIAGNLLEHYQADFLLSGEVLSQRPMSQRKDAMNAVAKLSGYRDLLVRPLSQKLLTDTKPIREGWISKDDMLDFSGRSRKPQMALAKELRVIEYPSPAGGCRLTDRNFSLRLEDLVLYNELSATEITLLKYGRHFRLDDSTKFIVGRDEADNDSMLESNNGFVLMQNETIPGPLGMLCSINFNPETLMQAASILAYYYTKAQDEIFISYGTNFPLTKQLLVHKPDSDAVRKFMITR